MDTYLLILIFVAGTIIGSFLNVVSLRFNTGKTVGGRSGCMSCGNQLTWLELIPIASFMMQGGACRNCRSKISWQYPLVEFVAGVIFVLIIAYFPPLSVAASIQTVIYMVITCLLLVITVYDVKHKIIPDQFAYSFDLLALLALFVGGSSLFHLPTFWQMTAGPLLALPFALIWLFSKGTWMGLGDAKLVIGIGWLVGISAGINALVLSFWLAAFFSVAWIYLNRRKFKPRTEIPFGPYLILGMYLVLIFNIQVLDLSLLKDILL